MEITEPSEQPMRMNATRKAAVISERRWPSTTLGDKALVSLAAKQGNLSIKSWMKLIIPVSLSYLGSEHEGDGGEVAVADGQQAEEGDVVTLVQEDDLKMWSIGEHQSPTISWREINHDEDPPLFYGDRVERHHKSINAPAWNASFVAMSTLKCTLCTFYSQFENRKECFY